MSGPQPVAFPATDATPAAPARQIEWQRLWFSLRAYRWQSLAVVGIDAATLADEAARRLVAVGTRDEKTPVEMISATGMSFHDAAGVVARLGAGASCLTIVACDSPAVNPAMIPIVQAVAGVVIVVKLGESPLDAVRRAVEATGRDKVLATVSVG